MMVNLQAAVVGLGEMGSHHARAITSLEGVDLAVIVDPRFAGHDMYGAPVVADLDRIRKQRVDMAVVAVPTLRHRAVSLELADLGVHPLIEQPLAEDVAACDEIRRAIESRGVIGGVGHIERFNPALIAMRQRIRDGLLGEIYQVVTRRQGPYPLRVKDVGVVMDLATHDLDVSKWLTDADYSCVTAQSSHRGGGVHEDMVAILGRLEGGIITSHLVNWVSPLKERTCVVTGSNGCLVADTLSGDLTYYKNGLASVEWDAVAAFRGVVEGDVVRYALPKREPLIVQLESFRDAVLGRGDVVVGLDAGTEAVSVSQAVLASLAAGGETVWLGL